MMKENPARRLWRVRRVLEVGGRAEVRNPWAGGLVRQRYMGSATPAGCPCQQENLGPAIRASNGHSNRLDGRVKPR